MEFNDLAKLFQQSSPILTAIIDNIHEAIFFIEKDGSIKYANIEASRILGYDRTKIQSMTVGDFDSDFKEQKWVEHWEIMKKTKSLTFESKFIDSKNRFVPIEINSNFFSIDNFEFIVGLVKDITEIKTSNEKILTLNRLNRTLSSCNDALIRAKNENELLQQICNIIVDTGEYRLTWVGYADSGPEKSVIPIAHAGTGSEYLNSIKLSWGDNELGQGPTGKAIRNRKIEAFNYYTSEFSAWKKEADKYGFQSSASFPLIVEDKIFGALNIYSNVQDAFNEDEFKLLRELADDLAFGIKSIRIKDAREEGITMLNEAQVILQKSEERYRSLFESSPVAILEEDFSKVKKLFDNLKNEGVTDIEKHFALHPELVQLCYRLIKIVDVNNTALDLYGYKEKESLNLSLDSKINFDSIDSFKQELVYLWKGKTNFKINFVIATISGQQRNVTIYFSVYHGSEESLSRIILSMIDITESKKIQDEIYTLNQNLEKRVKERTSQLETLNKELEAFSYSVSHDLRVPLDRMKGYVQLLQESDTFDSEIEEMKYIENINSSILQMHKLIDDILYFSHMGHKEMTTEIINIHDLIHEVINEFEPDLGNRSVHWNITSLPNVNGDKNLLCLVFTNLISNALKFTSKKPETIIDIGYWSEGGENIVFVRDNGVGFDMKNADKLFGVFQRFHSDKEFPGTGVGLANVRRIVTRHGGRIWAESELHKSSTFFISFPTIRISYIP